MHYLSIIEQGPLVLQKPSAFWGEISYVTAGVAAGVILVAGLSRSCPSPFLLSLLHAPKGCVAHVLVKYFSCNASWPQGVSFLFIVPISTTR